MKQFDKCEICSSEIGEEKYDSPLYCKKCIAGMEAQSMSPQQYKKYLELGETLGRK